MGIWVELGIFVLAIAFGLWQIHDVKKAREQTLRRRQQAQAQAEAEPPDAAQSAPRAERLSDRR